MYEYLKNLKKSTNQSKLFNFLKKIYKNPSIKDLTTIFEFLPKDIISKCEYENFFLYYTCNKSLVEYVKSSREFLLKFDRNKLNDNWRDLMVNSDTKDKINATKNLEEKPLELYNLLNDRDELQKVPFLAIQAEKLGFVKNWEQEDWCKKMYNYMLFYCDCKTIINRIKSEKDEILWENLKSICKEILTEYINGGNNFFDQYEKEIGKKLDKIKI